MPLDKNAGRSVLTAVLESLMESDFDFGASGDEPYIPSHRGVVRMKRGRGGFLEKILSCLQTKPFFTL